MATLSISSKIRAASVEPPQVPEEITDRERGFFNQVVTTELSPVQMERITTAPETYPLEKTVLGVHWHPEHIPLNLVLRRIDGMFPNRGKELIIPTQHNMLTDLNGYSGVEVDCYSSGFNQKVQLLLHFKSSNLENAHTLKKMLAHTFRYRSSQLMEYVRTIEEPVAERIGLAARETGASADLIDFVRGYVSMIRRMLEENFDSIPGVSIKNKLLRDFFDCLRDGTNNEWIDRAQNFLTAVKRTVKESFPLQYFYRTTEIIEEARSLGAGVVIPHPEQFWPVLLADYDVDGIEVWNPQSRRYTDFLVSIINQKNRESRYHDRELLVFMGDDTHFSEKTKEPGQQNPDKASREVGLQLGWNDLSIQKSLIRGNFSKERVIEEYRSRLAG